MGEGLVGGKGGDDALTCLAANARSAVVARNREVWLLPVDLGAPDQPCEATIRGHSQRETVCSLSNTRASRLALGRGSRICITEDGIPDVLLAGNGRVVTSLGWSSGNVDVIASGTVDGTICLWDITKPLLPVARVVSGSSPCRLLQFSPSDHSLFASCHANGVLRIWKVNDRSGVSELTVLKTDHSIIALSWHPYTSCRIATASSQEGVEVWDLASRESSSHGVVGNSHSIVRAWLSPDLSETFQEVVWLGSSSIAALTVSGKRIHVLDMGQHGTSSGPKLHFALEETLGQAQRILFAQDQTGAAIIAFDSNRFCRHPLPIEFASNSERSLGGDLVLPTRSAEQIRSASDDVNIEDVPAIRATEAVVDTRYKFGHKDVKSSMTHRENLVGASRAPFRMQEVSKHQHEESGSHGAKPRSSQEQSATDASPSATTKSLELPNPQEDLSSMPFLSPGVPGKNTSIEDSIHLPTLEDMDTLDLHDSTETPRSLASFERTEDSDSDDETFDGRGLHGSGSGTLLPGGINVPLPKVCGAVFAPNGQLLTFFRAKPLAALTAEVASEVLVAPGQSSARRSAKAFPSFGDLLSANQEYEDCSDDSSMSSADIVTGLSLSQFRSQAQWTAKAAPLNEAYQSVTDPRLVNVKVCEIPALSNYAYDLALEYRFTCEEGGCVSDVCRWNAQVACAVGISAIADAWEVLALIFDNKSAPSLLETSQANKIIDARLVEATQRESAQTTSTQSFDGIIDWCGHPFGSRWLLDRIFTWAEKLADIQLLAYMSALLVQQDAGVTKASNRRRTSRQIPVLRADIFGGPGLHESPTKIGLSSRPPSRQISQAGTPLLDTASSTPPLAFPSLYRQSSRLSASGSASPEHHRSSFSAAAKSYAQSITDRFAMYGTSPPAKKLSSSPGNELSNSLPTAGSSWSKSVSFAPSTATATGSMLSVAVGRGADDEGYDSDRTIEDSSLPPTPKGGGPVVVSLKNQDAFDGEATDSLLQPLLPPHVLAKSKAWRRYHAEQLRAWGLLQQAAEIEDGLGSPHRSTVEGWDAGHDGCAPISAKVTCGICACIIERLARICPRCSFTTHAHCSRPQRQDAWHQSDALLSCGGCVSE